MFMKAVEAGNYKGTNIIRRTRNPATRSGNVGIDAVDVGVGVHELVVEAEDDDGNSFVEVDNIDNEVLVQTDEERVVQEENPYLASTSKLVT